MADSVLALMTLDEKLSYIGGDRSFFTRPIPRLNLSEVYMTDATQGVHIREKFRDLNLAKYQLEKSTAFPCPLLLAATWESGVLPVSMQKLSGKNAVRAESAFCWDRV